jgi:cation-transporting ATPase E
MDAARDALRETLRALSEKNAVSRALLSALGDESDWRSGSIMPFSSERKWSGAYFEGKGGYILGAPRFVMRDDPRAPWDIIESYAKDGKRVLCLARTDAPLNMEGQSAGADRYDAAGSAGVNLPEGLVCAAIIVLSDALRPDAAQTIRFFANEGVSVKVISGDDPLTVAGIAKKAQIDNAMDYVDMSRIGGEAYDVKGASDGSVYSSLVDQYTVFGRASPAQKRDLVAALRRGGHTVCMTGDGVNDVLAMKEADCSIAMRSGSGAARGVSDFVLLTSDFAVMKKILYEGRKVINNIEAVSALYLIRTIYSALLSVLYIFMPAPYPFVPLQVTPINVLTVGVPSFFIALRRNVEKPHSRFAANIIEYSLPAALTIAMNILLIHIIGYITPLSEEEMGSIRMLLTGATGFYALYLISRPVDRELVLFFTYISIFVVSLFLFSSFFGLSRLDFKDTVMLIPLFAFIPIFFGFVRKVAKKYIRFAKSPA